MTPTTKTTITIIVLILIAVAGGVVYTMTGKNGGNDANVQGAVFNQKTVALSGEKSDLKLTATDIQKKTVKSSYCGAKKGQKKLTGQFSLSFQDSSLDLGDLTFVQGQPHDGSLHVKQVNATSGPHIIFLNQYSSCSNNEWLAFGYDKDTQELRQYTFSRNGNRNKRFTAEKGLAPDDFTFDPKNGFQVRFHSQSKGEVDVTWERREGSFVFQAGQQPSETDPQNDGQNATSSADKSDPDTSANRQQGTYLKIRPHWIGSGRTVTVEYGGQVSNRFDAVRLEVFCPRWHVGGMYSDVQVGYVRVPGEWGEKLPCASSEGSTEYSPTQNISETAKYRLFNRSGRPQEFTFRFVGGNDLETQPSSGVLTAAETEDVKVLEKVTVSVLSSSDVHTETKELFEKAMAQKQFVQKNEGRKRFQNEEHGLSLAYPRHVDPKQETHNGITRLSFPGYLDVIIAPTGNFDLGPLEEGTLHGGPKSSPLFKNPFYYNRTKNRVERVYENEKYSDNYRFVSCENGGDRYPFLSATQLGVYGVPALTHREELYLVVPKSREFRFVFVVDEAISSGYWSNKAVEHMLDSVTFDMPIKTVDKCETRWTRG